MTPEPGLLSRRTPEKVSVSHIIQTDTCYQIYTSSSSLSSPSLFFPPPSPRSAKSRISLFSISFSRLIRHGSQSVPRYSSSHFRRPYVHRPYLPLRRASEHHFVDGVSESFLEQVAHSVRTVVVRHMFAWRFWGDSDWDTE